MRIVVGLFAQFTNAHDAVGVLTERAYDQTDISLVAHDVARERAETAGTEEATRASGMLGLLDGFGELELPGVAPLIAAGPLLGLLTGALAGAGEDGPAALVKALQQAGVPEPSAARHARAIAGGASLLVVRTDDPFAAPIADTLDAHGAVTTISDLDLAL